MNIAIVGGKGKMGSMVANIATSRNHNVIIIDKHSSTVDTKCDIVIDFSVPPALDRTIELCLQNNCPLVSGVTGYDQSQLHKLVQLSQRVIVVNKSNFSQGVQATTAICQLMGKMLPSWQYNIIEQHHIAKIDSPSGTALSLAEALNIQPTTVHSIRAGDTIGTHTIIANGCGEYITITHHANNRNIFALGALLCAEQLLPTDN